MAWKLMMSSSHVGNYEWNTRTPGSRNYEWGNGIVCECEFPGCGRVSMKTGRGQGSVDAACVVDCRKANFLHKIQQHCTII